LIFTADGRFPWGMRQSSSEQSSCGVLACTLIPQESPPSIIINKEKSRKSTAKDNRANLLVRRQTKRHLLEASFVLSYY